MKELIAARLQERQPKIIRVLIAAGVEREAAPQDCEPKLRDLIGRGSAMRPAARQKDESGPSVFRDCPYSPDRLHPSHFLRADTIGVSTFFLRSPGRVRSRKDTSEPSFNRASKLSALVRERAGGGGRCAGRPATGAAVLPPLRSIVRARSRQCHATVATDLTAGEAHLARRRHAVAREGGKGPLCRGTCVGSALKRPSLDPKSTSIYIEASPSRRSLPLRGGCPEEVFRFLGVQCLSHSFHKFPSSVHRGGM